MTKAQLDVMTDHLLKESDRYTKAAAASECDENFVINMTSANVLAAFVGAFIKARHVTKE